MPAVNYTPLVNDIPPTADNLNVPPQGLDEAIEDIVAGDKALTAPTITSFANATHTHENAAGGGQLTADAIDSTGAADGDVLTSDGAGGAAWAAKLAPAFHRKGMRLFKVAADYLMVETGSVVVDGVSINKSVMTPLQPSVNAHWIDGATAEAASMWIWAYCDSAGNLRLHDKAPNYSAPATANRVFTGRVNQAGWIGTAGFGLDATSVIYDGDTGEANIEVGMLLGVYSDAAYTLGRGKGSGAGSSENYLSFALVTGIDTGTNTLTLESESEIGFWDNDYLIVIEGGAPEYRYEGTTWWRSLGAIWNDSGSDLSWRRENSFDRYTSDEVADYTTVQTSFVDVDADFALELVTMGGDIEVGFSGSGNLGAAGYLYFDIKVDGRRIGGDDGIQFFYSTSSLLIFPMSFSYTVRAVENKIRPGNHTVTLQWKVSTSTGKIYAGSGAASADIHPQFYAREVAR